jgi:hypothetical protein
MFIVCTGNFENFQVWNDEVNTFGSYNNKQK